MFLNRIVFAAIPSNRFVALIVFLILIAGTFASALAAPIQIGTIEDLQKIGNDSAYPPSGSYVLTQDIDASATATWNNGIGFAPIGNDSTPFTGTFDGQGHVISGLTINRLGEAGLFGMMDGQVKNVGLQGGSVTGSEYVGGLVGENRGTVTQCYATGAVSGRYVGGLVGENGGTVTQCYATGTVTGSGDAVGGLVGNNHIGTVTQCYATGTVTGSVDVGGLVGRSTNAGAQLTACYATGAVSGSDDVGGLVGHNDDIVRQCYATGAVSGSVDVGGLVGRNDDGGGVTQSYATGTVWGSGQYVGGLVGWSLGFVAQSYATGAVTGSDDVGGLVGKSDGTVRACYATGSVSGSGQYVGGLVAENDGTMTACYATGAVSGSDDVGGLVGRNGYYEPTTVTQCYATGAVSGSGQYVGGLVAENDGTVTACYAMGTVAGSDDVGGLVGKNNATVTQCYATGAVSGSGQYVGGLVGGHFGTVDSSYWDTETSGQATSADGTGEPTAAMMAQATFAGWDFTNIWDITEGKTYPCLRIGIPDVVGMTQSAAQAAITNAGLTVGTVTPQPSATVPAGEVISQSPVAETQVASGSAVDLVVSSGPPMQISVPYVTGMTQSAAQTAITNASLIVGTVSLEYSDTVSAEDVISQNPAADTSVAPSTPVNLTVSRGPQLTVGCFGGTTNNTSFGSPTGKNGDTVLLLSVSAGLCLVGSRRQRRLSLQ